MYDRVTTRAERRRADSTPGLESGLAGFLTIDERIALARGVDRGGSHSADQLLFGRVDRTRFSGGRGFSCRSIGWPRIWTRDAAEPMRTCGTGRDRSDGRTTLICSYETARIRGDSDRLAHSPEVAGERRLAPSQGAGPPNRKLARACHKSRASRSPCGRRSGTIRAGQRSFRVIVGQRKTPRVRLGDKWARLASDVFCGSVSSASGLGKQPQVATRSWIPRIRRERRPELFGDKRRLLGVVEPISKQHERLTHLSRSRSYQTVELKLVGCSRYVLTSRIGRTVACV